MSKARPVPELDRVDTFSRHIKQFNAFVDRIVASKPDYVVPVAKKGGKLLRLSQKPISNLRYRTFFQLHETPIAGKRIAVIDDATQHTATLLEHRQFFETRGATVDTYSFVGHEQLFDGRRIQQDSRARIEIFLADPVYQEYILQQSHHLLATGNHFDLDHVVLDAPLDSTRLESFVTGLARIGYVLAEGDDSLPKGTVRFGLDDVRAFTGLPYLHHPSISAGALRKLKFVHTNSRNSVAFTPLVFPTWRYNEGQLGKTDFRDLPFEIPLDIPDTASRKDSRGLFATYYAISLAYQVGLIKAFLQADSNEGELRFLPAVRSADLTPTLGADEAKRFAASVRSFLISSERWDFSRSPWPNRPAKRVYSTFGEVVDKLKSGYERAVAVKKRRLRVHYTIPYDTLFAQYPNRHDLSANLDRYCDLGVIVPETIKKNHAYYRACRSGEPNSDYSWKRTQLLIPLAIHQFLAESRSEKVHVGPTVLNKLLSTFQYDYPTGSYPQLHCIYGQPDKFGTMTHAYHRLHASDNPSLYQAERISPFYRFDDRRKDFFVVKHRQMVREIGKYFDDRQEIPYAELITYLRLLTRAYLVEQSVDVLNALSICREENYFYAHVLYNIEAAASELSRYQDFGRNRQIALQEARVHVSSATDKVRLARAFPALFRKIQRQLGDDPEFVKALQKVEKNYYPFSSGFVEELEGISSIISLQAVAATLALALETRSRPLERELLELDADRVVGMTGAAVPSLSSISAASPDFVALMAHLSNAVANRVASLRNLEPLLTTRMQHEEQRRARNIASSLAYELNLTQACICYCDFTGLRRVPQPKEAVVGEYYGLTRRAATKRNGVHLYGGDGGDDAFAWLFQSLGPALEFAKDLKREFGANLFLQDYDIKFGVSLVHLDGAKEVQMIQCWGDAKDCCEFKSPNFRNRGHLLASQRTMQAIAALEGNRVKEQFVELDKAQQKIDTDLEVYAYNGIAPFPGR